MGLDVVGWKDERIGYDSFKEGLVMLIEKVCHRNMTEGG